MIDGREPTSVLRTAELEAVGELVVGAIASSLEARGRSVVVECTTRQHYHRAHDVLREHAVWWFASPLGLTRYRGDQRGEQWTVVLDDLAAREVAT